jgi:acyl transferase domain-containing protein/acyl carrier protein
VSEDGGGSGIAIVGMACRVPGARDLDEFWRNLEEGVESVTVLSDEELLRNGVEPEVLADPAYVKARPVLADHDRFDAGLFRFTPREAELLDPQHRLFLELAFQALEDSGHDPARYRGEIGVYGGAASSRYGWLNLRLNRELHARVGSLAIVTAASPDYLCTIVSYKLGLRGPSLTVQTACSTSLVAVHLACESLRNGECDLALAGGVGIEIPQVAGYHHHVGGIESPDGHCRAFDAAAGGTVWGSGGGVVALKRLDDAIADGDRLYAVVRGTAINNDGSAKAGFSAPSVRGQTDVILQAHAVGQVDPATISYVEAHGTGTAVGDPMEVAALTEAFRRSPVAPGSCAIGSVKTNIGHLGPGAGVAGLIKTVLAVQHRAIPPSLNFERPNPRLNLDSSPFYVNAALTRWEPSGDRLRAGVSSFGIGGTNAHVVIEEPPATAPGGPSRTWQVLVLSAVTGSALGTATGALAGHLRLHPDTCLADVAHTLQVGRQQFAHRRALVCSDPVTAADALARPSSRRVHTGEARPRRVAFLFPGQGSQRVDMARDLYEREQGFRQVVDECAEILRPHLGLDIRSVVFPSPADAGRAAQELVRTALAQPALFTIELALARLLASWGVEPEALIGHSIGEYVAACVAGVWQAEDALSLVAARGRLLQSLETGSMLAVQLAADQLGPYLGPELAIAAVNAPGLAVASGPRPAIERLRAALEADGVSVAALRTSHAFHSPMVEPVMEEFAGVVRRHRPAPPALPFVSNVTGTWITDAEATDPAYWARHLREPVLFGAGLARLLEREDRVFVELGPGRTLTGLVRLQAPRTVTATHALAADGGSDQEQLMTALAQLWVTGAGVDWEGVRAGERRRRVSLPGYPLERERYWVDPPRQAVLPRPAPAGRLPVDHWFHLPAWRQSPRPPGAVSGGDAAGRRWLVLEDGAGLAAEVVERLRAAGAAVVAVRTGSCFERTGACDFVVDPLSPSDLEALCDGLRDGGLVPDVLVHALAVDETATALQLDPDALARGEGLGFFSLLSLFQALAARQVAGPARLVAVTSQALAVMGEELLRPAGALVAGPVRVLPAERPGLTAQHVDVVLPAAGSRDRPVLVDRLMDELLRPAEDDVVALRRSARWTRTVEPLPVAAAAGRLPLQEQGVYLVTGGLGAIGLAIADDLARRFRARLVLVGRTPLPEPAAWDAWLAEHGDADRTGRRIRALRELERAGAELLVLAADVADAAEMTAVREAALARFGRLDGIVHAAGVAGGGMFEVRAAEDARRVLAPKVAGTAVLAAVFGDLDLAFVSLCSSVTAEVGGFGQVDYCAANAFLDAVAATRAFGDAPVTSIGWSAWAEGGMAVETAAPEAFRQLARGTRQEAVDHPLLERVEVAEDGEAVYTAELSPARHWVLDEHRIGGVAVLPGTTYLELARAAFQHRGGPGPVELLDVDFLAPLAVPDGESRRLRLLLGPGDRPEFRILSQPSGRPEGWQEHARGRIGALAEAADPPSGGSAAPPGDGEQPGSHGIVTLGAHWSSLRRVWSGPSEATAELVAGEATAGELARLPLHPALLDEATTFADIGEPGQAEHYLPLAYGRLALLRPLTPRLFARTRYRQTARDGVVSLDIGLHDEAGRLLAAIDSFVLRRVDQGSVEAAVRSDAAGVSDAARAAPSGAIRPAEGAEAHRRALAVAPGGHVVVSPVGLDQVRAAAARMTQETIERELAAGRLTEGGGERMLQTPFVAPRTPAERALAAIWSEILGVQPVGAEDDFFSLGGNSLVAIQLVSMIKDRLDVELPMRSLFEAPTVAGMAELVGRRS